MTTLMENLLSGQGESTRTCNAGNGAQVGGYGNCVCKTLHYLLIGVFGVGWLNNKSRMSREVHVRVCEQLRGEAPFGWLDRYLKVFFIHLKRSVFIATRWKTEQSLNKWSLIIPRSFIIDSDYIQPMIVYLLSTIKKQKRLSSEVSKEMFPYQYVINSAITYWYALAIRLPKKLPTKALSIEFG